MDMMKTHGAFSWVELTTTDTEAALGFYTQLFGWKVQTMETTQGNYNVLSIGDTPIGGVAHTPPGVTMPPIWGCYVTVDNVDFAAMNAETLGGRVLVAPMDMPGVGRFSIIQDPQGAVLNLVSYAADQG